MPHIITHPLVRFYIINSTQNSLRCGGFFMQLYVVRSILICNEDICDIDVYKNVIKYVCKFESNVISIEEGSKLIICHSGT